VESNVPTTTTTAAATTKIVTKQQKGVNLLDSYIKTREFDFLTTLIVTFPVFWDMTPCKLVYKRQGFERA
jgi:hypothetical protein